MTTFRIKVSSDDFAAFYDLATRRVIQHGGIGWKHTYMNIGTWVLFGVCAAATYHTYQRVAPGARSHLNIAVLFGCLFILAALLVNRWLASVYRRVSADEAPVTVLGEKTIQLGERIVEKGPSHTHEVASSCVTDVVKDAEDRLFLFTGLAGAIIIPLKSVNPDDRRLIKEYLRATYEYDL